MKAQMIGEDFIIGFIFFFLLATTVFLFINGGGGSNIDFFNTSIYQEDVFLMDYVYLSGYDLNTGNFDPSKIIISATFNPYSVTSIMAEQYLNVSFNITRTGFPAGDYDESIMRFPIKYYVYYQNYTQTEGVFYEKIEDEIRQTYKYDEIEIIDFSVFNSTTIYPDCSSNITIYAEMISQDYNETMLNNNEYNLTFDFCVFKKYDLEINNTNFKDDEFNVTIYNYNDDHEFFLSINFLNISNNEWENINLTNFKVYKQGFFEEIDYNGFSVNENSWINISFALNDFYIGENIAENKVFKCSDFNKFRVRVQSSIVEYDLNNNEAEQIIGGCP